MSTSKHLLLFDGVRGRCMAPVWWALAVLLLLVGCATGAPLGGWTSAVLSSGMGGAGGFSVQRSGQGEALTCGGVAMPAGWPDLSSGDAEALLAPLLKCPSPGDYVALQQRVDMPRLVEALDDWRAMRLAALGPVRADAVGVLNAKRVSFLLAAAERYGLVHAEVFTLYVLHATHDDEVDAVLRWLARDKRLGRTLGLMPAVREELAERGLPLSAYAERGEQAGDVLRGLGRAARDVLSTSQASDGLRYMEMAERRGQLPAPYQDALHEVEVELARRHFAPGSVAVGSLDAATFGVPLGFFYLVVGTGEGLSSLSRGEYEQATRELAPAALVVGVYAGGRGVRALGEARGLGRVEARLSLLRELGRQWEARLGVEGARELLRDIRARREAAHFVALGGADAALALREARMGGRVEARERPALRGCACHRRGSECGTVTSRRDTQFQEPRHEGMER